MSRFSIRGLAATGTRDATTYLRGDGTWNVPPTGSTATFHGVKVTRSSTLTLSNGTAIDWNAEEYDTDGYHSLVTNINRLTVPTGLAGYYHVGYTIELSNSGGSRKAVFPGGTFTAGGSVKGLYSDGPSAVEVSRQSSAPIYFADGDFVNLVFFISSGSCTLGTNGSAFWMYRVGT